ncbi:Uncharacterized protein dnm_044290 [Desulfonema magnum]|uniref:Uncharacterized protein n=1 Tax=Desulfonema magnum TaxID=45655 RepID=A0A975BMF5_9BACT|nr:Uncharacterized protein dnm_044290 [Desulfonema magnum]
MTEKPGFFSRTEDSPRRKKPGFSPVCHVCPATARKLFDLLSLRKQNVRPDQSRKLDYREIGKEEIKTHAIETDT